jgi:hypothetical protein
MDIQKLQAEVNMVAQSTFARKSDKQLISYDILSSLHKSKYQGAQPIALKVFNDRKFKKCKLTTQQVNEIRIKYNPHVHGKYKLAERIRCVTKFNLQNYQRRDLEINVFADFVL